MPAKLETEQLTYEVGTERLVDGVSLTIEAKSTVAIIGPSGAGKSSLLRLLNRLNEPTDRTVMYDGQDYRELDPQQLRTHIGLVPQDSAFIDGNVWENVTLGPRLRNEAVDQQRARTLLARDVIQAVQDALSPGGRFVIFDARARYREGPMRLLNPLRTRFVRHAFNHQEHDVVNEVRTVFERVAVAETFRAGSEYVAVAVEQPDSK